MVKQGLKVLFYPIDAVGHVNSAIGIAQSLLAAGHQPTFFITDNWRGKLCAYGFQEVIYPTADISAAGGDDPARYWYMKLVEEGCMASGRSPLDNMIGIRTKFKERLIAEIKRLTPILLTTLADLQPDLIVLDNLVFSPAVEISGIPWVWTNSCGPLFIIDDPDCNPPPGSGLSVTGDRNEWKLFRQTVNESTLKIWTEYNQYVVSMGATALKKCRYFNPSPYLNIYPYPKELDYTDCRPLPPHHKRFDTFMRVENQSKFEIPVSLRDRPGKLVYFSLGSMGAADVDNMKRLVNILSKSKHRFIVSKGPLHNEYSLTDNMWGEGSVPQIQVLPLVDLVITHGGNNTITETFYFGKPMIVMPIFVDQYDNAQRVQDKGFGIRLDVYKCSEEELLNAIERLLYDYILIQNLQNISQRIQSDNSIAKLPQLFEDIIEKNKIHQ